MDDLQRIMDFLDQYCREQGNSFVHGRGKQASVCVKGVYPETEGII